VWQGIYQRPLDRLAEARNHAALRFGILGVPFSSPHKPIDAAAN
jgi:hypothetical protein